jgi:hypothetical protein
MQAVGMELLTTSPVKLIGTKQLSEFEHSSHDSPNIVDATTTRRAYVEALRAANAHELLLLIAFARS